MSETGSDFLIGNINPSVSELTYGTLNAEERRQFFIYSHIAWQSDRVRKKEYYRNNKLSEW
jgi:hypothetical protein